VNPIEVLAGDVGGTNARFARVAAGAGPVVLRDQATYPVADAASLGDLVHRYLGERPGPVAAAAVGIAAPIVAGTARAVNLPWAATAAEVADAIGGGPADLLNDLLANAWGIGELPDDAFHELQPDRLGQPGNRAVCSAGTGLGIAGIAHRPDGGWLPFASEGGHIDFGPRDADEDALLLFLRAHHPAWEHVSAERVVSGPGIGHIWEFLVETGRAEAGDELRASVAAGDPAAAIARAATDGADASAVAAMAMFARAYGAQAGNLALSMLSTGGLYLGGGIAPRNLALLEQGGFLEAFRAKGRYDGLLERMPVRVILDDLCALRGAARWALELAAAPA
jgi:glucokinase